MGKAARVRQARRTVPAPPKPNGTSDAAARRWILIATGVLVLAVGAVVAALAVSRSGGGAPPPAASPSAAELNASPELRKAADAVGFRPNVEPGVGQIESQPASAAAPPSTPDLLAVGSQAPDFTLRTPTGETVSLSGLRGKPVLLEFFATWCPHCAAEAPHLARLARQLDGKASFVSVNADGEDAASVFAYHRYFGLPFPALLDPSTQPGSFHSPGAPGPVTQDYRVQSFPTFYVLDARGKIAWRGDGEQPDALLRQELERAA